MNHAAGTGKVGITGFCYGGGVVNAAAVAYPELGAAVSFYGRQPEARDVPRIQAPLMLHYGELDTRITEGWPAFEQALKAAGKTYEGYVYPGVNHGFHNDSTLDTMKPLPGLPGAGRWTGLAGIWRPE